MNTTTHTLVQKLWNYCSVLRDDGMSYGDYVEQLTYLLFLKMADERSKPPYNQTSIVPAAYAWPTLLVRDGDDLFDHYRHALEKLGQEKGTLGLIFAKAQNKFQDPAKLRRVIVDLIDAETWTVLGADVKGDAYEGLLEKNAQDTKSGAGQYFTPRALIAAMVECIDPKPAERVCDSACGTGGFLFNMQGNWRPKCPNSLAAARTWPMWVMHEPMKASSMCVPDTSVKNLAELGSLGQQTMGSLVVGKNFELKHTEVLSRRVDECGRFTL